MRIGQSRRHSAVESIINILVGFWIAFITNLFVLPYFGFNVSIAQNVAITCIFTAVSFIRSYFLRRLFNYLHLMDIL